MPTPPPAPVGPLLPLSTRASPRRIPPSPPTHPPAHPPTPCCPPLPHCPLPRLQAEQQTLRAEFSALKQQSEVRETRGAAALLELQQALERAREEARKATEDAAAQAGLLTNPVALLSLSP